MDDWSVRQAINSARKGISQYMWLMRTVHSVDVTQNRDFQRKYNAFYRVRQRSQEWYSTYYDLLESRKGSGIAFAEVLDHLWDNLGRYEPSFSSKLAATTNADLPVWDQFVLVNTGLRAPSYTDPQRRAKAKLVYGKITAWYARRLSSPEGQRMIDIFCEEIDEHAEISDLKKLDFILWQSRHS